jgi:hypothetical protein
MSFRIRVEGRREACFKRLEARMQCILKSSEGTRGGGQAGILKSIEGKREACILKSIEGSWGRHASSRALKGGRRHASRALRQE